MDRDCEPGSGRLYALIEAGGLGAAFQRLGQNSSFPCRANGFPLPQNPRLLSSSFGVCVRSRDQMVMTQKERGITSFSLFSFHVPWSYLGQRHGKLKVGHDFMRRLYYLVMVMSGKATKKGAHIETF